MQITAKHFQEGKILSLAKIFESIPEFSIPLPRDIK